MADVLQCPCGWPTPVNVRRLLDPSESAAAVLIVPKPVHIVFDCPRCGQSYVHQTPPEESDVLVFGAEKM